MPSLQEISEAAAAECERCVTRSMQIDYAWMTGRLDAWVEAEYARLMEITSGRNNGPDPRAQ
jgi:hypothetical protein